MRSTLTVRFAVHKGRAAARGIQDLQFARDDYYLPPEFAAPRRFFATTGLSVTRDGESRPEDLTLAARNALLNMIDHLQDHGGWTRQQAYAICSVAVDLKVSRGRRRAQLRGLSLPPPRHLRGLAAGPRAGCRAR